MPKLWASYRRLLSVRSLATIIGVSVSVGGCVIAGFRFAFPNIVVPNLWPMVAVLPGLLLVLAMQLSLLTAIKPSVSVNATRIKRTHGETRFQIKMSDLSYVRLYFHTRGRARLKLRHRAIRADRIKSVGVPCDLDFDALLASLPDSTMVFDARSRCIPNGG